jgi:hypothetical protein
LHCYSFNPQLSQYYTHCRAPCPLT